MKRRAADGRRALGVGLVERSLQVEWVLLLQIVVTRGVEVPVAGDAAARAGGAGARDHPRVLLERRSGSGVRRRTLTHLPMSIEKEKQLTVGRRRRGAGGGRRRGVRTVPRAVAAAARTARRGVHRPVARLVVGGLQSRAFRCPHAPGVRGVAQEAVQDLGSAVRAPTLTSSSLVHPCPCRDHLQSNVDETGVSHSQFLLMSCAAFLYPAGAVWCGSSQRLAVF